MRFYWFTVVALWLLTILAACIAAATFITAI
jgi:hypothetical protein